MKRIGLVQINNSFSGQNYLPYSVGILQAYAMRHLSRPGDFEFLLPIYARVPVEQAVCALEEADIVFFSAYVWNIRISLEIAGRLKERSPDCRIIFGGPQVPDRTEVFLRKNRFIDLACNGEGEQAFAAILEHGEDLEKVPSISYLDRNGTFVQRPRAPRIKDLPTVPSPYLEGVFDTLMECRPQERWIALWETNRGCPFSCTFCDWGSAVASKLYSFDLERLQREIQWFADHRIEYVFCADANFGILPRDVELTRHVAEVKRSRGYPHALSVQSTKNATERAYQVQKILADAGLNKGVAISMQSMDPTTLKAIKRDNISLKTYSELQRRFTRDRVETYSDMILGLPEETYDSFVDGVAAIIEGGQHNRIQFNNLSILPNAEMNDPDYRAKYGIETVVSRVVNIHGELTTEEVYEEQELVVATKAMPRDQWVRTRAFCWMTALLYFDKVFQIPLTVARHCCDVRYRELLEFFTEGDLADYPTLSEIREFFRVEARRIQDGGAEYVYSKEWLGIWWPADEYILIRLTAQGKLEAFYREAQARIASLLTSKDLALPSQLLADAVRMNCALLKQPFVHEDCEIELGYNVMEFYRSALEGTAVPLEARPSRYRIDRSSQTWSSWDAWCREVIWWGNKKGAYLYGNAPVSAELAGHF